MISPELADFVLEVCSALGTVWGCCGGAVWLSELEGGGCSGREGVCRVRIECLGVSRDMKLVRCVE